MAFKALFGAVSGDMLNDTDLYGYYNDTVYVVNQATTRSYTIATYRGNDLVDLLDANANNSHSVYGGAGNDTVLGGLAVDDVVDQSGNDIVSLGAGNDSVIVGRGNDLYVGGDGIDLLNFRLLFDDFGSSIVVTSGVRFDMAITKAQNLGIFGLDRISGFEFIIGTDGNDTLLGAGAVDTLQGVLGNDILLGRGGADSLYGGAGSDVLIGGAGGDRLGAGPADIARDIIRYTSMADSGLGTQANVVDRISDFDPGTATTDDRIDLSAIDAFLGTRRNDAFTFRETGGFISRGGEVRLEVVGADTLVHIDIDSDAASEMNILIVGVTGLTAVDFIL
jgi:Ca2+-binding RTX toxin-like protein